MAKNQVQFQRGYSLFEFMDDYGSEEKCEQALFQWRFPEGYVCRECGNTTYCQLKSRKILQCNRCRHQHSLTSGTLFESTKLPLSKWFLAIHLLTQSKTGISAMSLKRELDVNYDTAWKLKHKLLQAMKESDDKHSLRGIVQIDDVYWGGKRRGGKRGRGAEGKTSFVAAVSVNPDGHPQKMRMTVVDGFTNDAIEQWSNRHLAPESTVISDKLACFSSTETAGCYHFGLKTSGNYELMDSPLFKWVNVMIGNVKNSLKGSCHSINPKHLPRYLAEYCFRFNHRFNLREMLPKLAQVAVRTPAMPYRLLKMAELSG
ncbi:IS1595 family transposase [Litoribacillus peritrichatus]|uniref:IS1595-like element ISXca4 family transposase n=1 Tax=Litoribacillus peritrichatus TaxID=718191 RepID=A0ABP7MUK7_9GAMM